jgi:hypothetical protein
MTDKVTMYVARGRTVQVGTWDKPEGRGPGELVTLDAAEAERLEQLGFLQSTPPVNLPLPTGNNPANIGLQGGQRVQGPNYDGGR